MRPARGRRKTDFFTGAGPNVTAQDAVMKAFLKNKDRHEEDKKEQAAKDKKRKAEEEKRRARLEASKAKQQKQEEEERIVEITDAAPPPADPPAEPAAASGEAKEDGENDESEGKGLQPINNGGICENYRWTQTLQDLQVLVGVPAGTKAKMLVVDIAKKHLKVGVKGAASCMIDDELLKVESRRDLGAISARSRRDLISTICHRR